MPKKENSHPTYDIEREALGLIRREKTMWEDSTAFVTDKVSFMMRNLIRQLRKNYWGVFDAPIDLITQRKKIWIPLVESYVEVAVSKLNIDTKDVTIMAKRAASIGITPIVRSILGGWMEDHFFGLFMNDMARILAIDGTLVVKVMTERDPRGKKDPAIKYVDLLNWYIDPVAKNIETTPSVIERAIMTKDDFMAMDGWINKEGIKTVKNPNLYDAELPYGTSATTAGTGETEMVEVYERWGKMPLSLITGNQKDGNTWIDGRIVASGINTTAGKVHLIRKNPSGVKPYKECWYTRVPNRWYGKGVVEKLMMLQLWLNTVANIRINRSYVSQLGIFKIKRGRGITPQMLARLAANGAILVQDMTDIEQLVMQEASQASYQDENTIKDWSERLTAAFEAVTGESMPAGTKATVAALQSKAAQTQFGMIKEEMQMFLERLLKFRVLPVILENFKKGDVVQLTGEASDLKRWDERAALQMAIEKAKKGEIRATEDQVIAEFQNYMQKMEAMGNRRWTNLLGSIDAEQFDVDVVVGNERIDKAVMVDKLIQTLQLVAQIPDSGYDPAQIVNDIYDLMGLDAAHLRKRPTFPIMEAPKAPPVAQPNKQPQEQKSLIPTGAQA